MNALPPILRELPAVLADQVTQLCDRLPELLALSVQSPPIPAQLSREILAFLASQPTPAQIAAFAPPQAMQERLQVLLERTRAGALTPSEQIELDAFAQIEHLIIMLKAANLPALTATPCV